ncbi:hypothetical protein BD560DRAFT_405930, partial [Blakeslea trispora]
KFLSSTKEIHQENYSDCKLVRLQIRNESGSDNQANEVSFVSETKPVTSCNPYKSCISFKEHY